jgi:predicted nuclease of predicted toxin-antitoxin system
LIRDCHAALRQYSLRHALQDAIHIGDIGLSEASDEAIMRHALKEDRIIVTLDADIHSMLAIAASSKPSVLRIREIGLRGPQLAALILRISNQFKTELLGGCVMTFGAGKVRYRALPL